jgi:hypothetical protein
MITLHGTAKRFSEGFVPMVTLRGDKGQMMGCRTPQGGYREFRTYTNEHDAVTEAKLICCRIAQQYPDVLKVCI